MKRSGTVHASVDAISELRSPVRREEDRSEDLLMRFLARKWKAAERVCRTEGLSVLLWELFYQCLKPFLRVYARLLWQWYRSRGHYSFSVQGHQLTVLPKDEGISRELAVYRVHEPVAANFAQLSKNVEANGYRNILLHDVAIGTSNGTVPMYLSKKSNWHSL